MSGTTPTPLPLETAGPEVGALQQLQRLLKLAALHAPDNQAMRQAFAQTQLWLDRATMGGGIVSYTFGGEAIWVNGRLLKARRQAYETCRQIGEALDRVGANQLIVTEGCAEAELRQLLRHLQPDSGSPGGGPAPALAHLSLRRVEVRLPTGVDEGSALAEEQAVRLYSAAVVLTGRLHAELSQGRTGQIRQLKRLAHRLVMGGPPLREIAVLRSARRDEPSRAVNTALFAMFGAGRVTLERRVLLRLVSAALVQDLGRLRLAGRGGALDSLSQEEKKQLPGANAFMCLLGRQPVGEALTRASLLFEAQWLARAKLLGPPYGGSLRPALEPALITVARRLINRVASQALVSPISLGEAALALGPELGSPLERQALELILQGVAIVPPGATARLESGWLARVVATAADAALNRRPRVRLLRGPNGEPPPQPPEVDLAEETVHGRVVRVQELPEALAAGRLELPQTS